MGVREIVREIVHVGVLLLLPRLNGTVVSTPAHVMDGACPERRRRLPYSCLKLQWAPTG